MDIYLKNQYDKYTQIDLAVLTHVGIIVFEIKAYSGWLYGTGNKSQWTQVLAFGKNKYKFYNPVMQNKKHIEDLKIHLGKNFQVPCFSVIVFFGNCQFKSIDSIPKDTFIIKENQVYSIIYKILSKNPKIESVNRLEIQKSLRNAVITGENRDIKNQHIKDIQDMLSRRNSFD